MQTTGIQKNNRVDAAPQDSPSQNERDTRKRFSTLKRKHIGKKNAFFKDVGRKGIWNASAPKISPKDRRSPFRYSPLSNLEGDSMKTLRFALCALTLLLMASGAFAQTQVRANVPFDFVVGDRYYSAGEYSLKTISDAGVMRITNTDVEMSVNVGSNSCAMTSPSEKTVLEFRRMGDMYFLHRVWVAGDLTGREFPRSNGERRLAQLHEKSEIVIVAANVTK
jgi:hypothetical protein